MSRYRNDRDTAALDRVMRTLDNDEAEAKRERDQDGIPAAVAVRYLRDLAETWRAAEGGRGRRMLAEALFERIEARGFQRVDDATDRLGYRSRVRRCHPGATRPICCLWSGREG